MDKVYKLILNKISIVYKLILNTMNKVHKFLNGKLNHKPSGLFLFGNWKFRSKGEFTVLPVVF